MEKVEKSKEKMKIRLNTVIYVLWTDSHTVSVQTNAGKDIVYGGDTVQIFFKDGGIESMPEEDFRLSGARQLTEARSGSISGLYQMVGPIRTVKSVQGEKVTFDDGDTITVQQLKSDFETLDPEPNEEALASQAIDIASTLEALFISVKMVNGIDLAEIVTTDSVN